MVRLAEKLKTLKNKNQELEHDNKDYKERIVVCKENIETQRKIKEIYTEKVEEKREKYKLYIRHLQTEKDNQKKKLEALKLNLEKIYHMHKELSIFLKLTKANYTNGLQFLDVLKEIDGQGGELLG